jgi:PAS domain-containing protein
MRQELEKRVKERTRALVESETRYRSLAEEYSAVTNVSPVGIFSMRPGGLLNYANPTVRRPFFSLI